MRCISPGRIGVREMNMTAEKVPFATGDLVAYHTHGVGEITAIEMQEIAS